VIVVDDASDDETPSGLRLRQQRALRVIRLARQCGVAGARNVGADAARGEWIAFLDDDDLWSPDRLARMLAAGRAARAGAVAAATVTVDAEGLVVTVGCPPDSTRLEAALRETNVLGGPSSLIIRKPVLEALGGFDERYQVLADWELWLRLVRVTPIAICPEPLNGYTVHPGSMHVERTSAMVKEYHRLQTQHGVARRPGEPGLFDLEFMRWVAGVHRQAGRHWRAAGTLAGVGVRHRRAADVARALAWAVRVPRSRPHAPPPRPAWLARYALDGPGPAERARE
jgi:hypothetical protein